MSRTYVPEEDTRVADITELQNLYPTSKRVVFVESKDNFYWWEPGGDASTANGDNLVASSVSGFTDGDLNEGLWHLSASNIAGNTTDDLTEGVTNLYFTQQRARNSLSASGDLNYDSSTGEFSITSLDLSQKTTDDLAEGSTNLYYTDNRVQTYLDSGITIDAKLQIGTPSGTTDTDLNVYGDVDVTGGFTTVTTDGLSEGNNNLYYTQNRFDNDFNAKTTDSLTEGSSNLYFRGERVDNRVDTIFSDDDFLFDSPFKLSSAVFSNDSFYDNETFNGRGVKFDDDGDQLFLPSNDGGVYIYDLTSSFDITSKSFNTFIDFSSDTGSSVDGLSFNDNGSKLYLASSNNNNIYEYNLSTNYDITTASLNSTKDVSSNTNGARGVTFGDGGSKMYITDGSLDEGVRQYSLSTPYDISTATFEFYFSVQNIGGGPTSYGVEFVNDGKTALIVGDEGDVLRVDNSTPFDLSTGSFSSAFDVTANTAAGEEDIRGIVVEGDRLVIAGQDENKFYEFTGIRGELSVNINLSGFTTDDLPEGSSNLYFTEQRARNSVSASGDLNYDPNTGVFSISSLDLSQKTTDDLSEGSSNLYFTEQRAQNAVSASGDINLKTEIVNNAYDLTTASYSGKNFNVQDEAQKPVALTFSGDGNKMFIVGKSSSKVYQYNLTKEFDVSTASYSGKSFDLSGQDQEPAGIAFSNDGSKMFMLGSGVTFEYNLTTGFDLSTASYSGTSYDMDLRIIAIGSSGIVFNDDGTKLFGTGDESDRIFEYNLTNAFDLSTASYSGNEFSITETESQGVTFNGDGTKMFVVGDSNQKVFEYDLTIGFDLSTASYSGTSFDLGSEDADPRGVTFNGNGSNMFVAGNANNNVYQYDVGTTSQTAEFNLDISELSATDLFGNKTTDDLPEGANNLYFSDERVDDRVNNLIVPGLNLTSTYNDNTDSLILDVDNNLSSYNVDITTDDLPEGSSNLYFTEQRAQNAVSASGDINLKTEIVNNAYDLTTASFLGKSFGVNSEADSPQGVTFNGDGTKMFVVARNNFSIYEYDLTTGFDLSTASYSGTSFDVSSEDFSPQEVHFNGDGTKMFIVGRDNVNVYEYDLTTGFDLSTASYSGTSFDVLSEDDDPQGITFNGDGTKMFIVGRQNRNIYEYDLTTGFDLSTASYSGTSFDVSSEDKGGRGVRFNGDGTRMFMVGGGNQSIFEYGLTTGFDLSTASYLGSSLDVSSEPGTPTGVQFNGDGSKMFMVTVGVADSVYEYNVGTTSQAAEFNLDISELSATDLFGNKTTDDLPEGANNLYFSDERVDDRVNTLLEAGNAISLSYDDQNDTLTISGQQVTKENIQDDAWDVLTGTQTLINVTYDGPNDEVDFIVESNLSQYTNDAGFITDLTSFTTDNLLEGSSNLYYTDARVDNEINRVRPAGQDTFSGDGSSKTFTISHGLGVVPDSWLVHPGTDDASGISHTTATDTTLTVHYDSAPPSGTGNIVLNWFVDSVGTNFAPLWQNQQDVTYEK